MNNDELEKLATEWLDRECDVDDLRYEGGSTSINKLMRSFVEAANPAKIIELLDTIEQQKETLVFVERWACHHGSKPNMTAEQALSFIQHYPPIKAITKVYADGVVPDTYDPYAVIEQQRKLLERSIGYCPYGSQLREEIDNHLYRQEGESK